MGGFGERIVVNVHIITHVPDIAQVMDTHDPEVCWFVVAESCSPEEDGVIDLVRMPDDQHEPIAPDGKSSWPRYSSDSWRTL